MTTNSAALIVPPPGASATNQLAQADIRQAKPPVALPSGWAWAWSLLLLLALAAAGYWAWRRWRKRPPPAEAERLVPPHVRARERLRAALALLGQPEPFCVEVSQTVRVYLEECFNLRAPERTTEEFLEELQTSPLLALGQKRSLADFLMRCDLVKFARYEPREPELRDLYDAAVRLVEETEPLSLATAPPAAAPPTAAAPPLPAPTASVA
jgi:hypothetical protein